MCKSCCFFFFKGVNITNKKNKASGQTKNFQFRSDVEVTASAFGEYRESNQVPVMCAVTWLCVLEAPPTAVFRPSYNRRGKPWVRHSTPCESLLSVFIDWGMNENTHTHTRALTHKSDLPQLVFLPYSSTVYSVIFSLV